MWDLVRAAHGHPVGVPAPTAGLRLGNDVLASPGGIEPGRGLAAAARATTGRTPVGRQAGLVPHGDRLLACAGRQTWPKSGPSPVNRARPGSKHHVLTEGAGIPLAVSLTGGNRHDVTELLSLIDKIPPVRNRRGRPRQRPDQLFADRAYDHDKYRRAVRRKGHPPSDCPPWPAPRLRSRRVPVGRRTHDRLGRILPIL
ncbi:IS4/IS5 family transposase [Verrucosispora sp. FIM060022]|nr:IS4/IS5 family transposase [Verrucosispora sp. FIM060022]